MLRRIFYISMGILLSWSLTAQEELDPIIFIADASNTMEKVMARESKMSIVQNVITEWRDYVDPNKPVGLVAYGHRSRYDCEDIEMLVDLDSKDSEEFQKEIDKLKPYGRTPLASSVSFVFEKLDGQERPVTIILLTDGIETCGGNLCEVVREALDDGIDFNLHIVGFDLKNKDRSVLECAAQTAGGLYVDARNRKELTAALTMTRSLSMQTE